MLKKILLTVVVSLIIMSESSVVFAQNRMNFKLPITPISHPGHPGLSFSYFSNRNLLIFYYSPRCPSCLYVYPSIQSMADKYRNRGLVTILITSIHSSRNDIRDFIDMMHVQLPIFKDDSRKFSDNYGNGFLPAVFLVKADGTYIRHSDVGYTNGLTALEIDIKNLLNSHSKNE